MHLAVLTDAGRRRRQLGFFFTNRPHPSVKYRFSMRKAVLYSSKSGTFLHEKHRFSFYQHLKRCVSAVCIETPNNSEFILQIHPFCAAQDMLQLQL
jgi:hypothetical protein